MKTFKVYGYYESSGNLVFSPFYQAEDAFAAFTMFAKEFGKDVDREDDLQMVVAVEAPGEAHTPGESVTDAVTWFELVNETQEEEDA